MMTTRILIVDDHAIVRQGIRLMLESQPTIEVVGEAADGAMAMQMARSLQPDVILMDLLMPGTDGVEGIQRIRGLGLPIHILVLSSSLEDRLIQQALQAGAHGYLLKTSRPADLLRAIEQVRQGYPVLDPAASQSLIRQVSQRDPLDTLTDRERDVFDRMARGMNNSEIAEEIIVSEGTVRTHVANVLAKLQLRDRTQVMIYALKQGLIRVDELP